PPDRRPFGLSRGSPRGHDRGHLGAIAVPETDLGAEVASKAVANEDAGRARRRERPLPETGHDRGIGLVTDSGPPRHQQRDEHHREVAHAPLPDESPTRIYRGRPPRQGRRDRKL